MSGLGALLRILVYGQPLAGRGLPLGIQAGT